MYEPDPPAVVACHGVVLGQVGHEGDGALPPQAGVARSVDGVAHADLLDRVGQAGVPHQQRVPAARHQQVVGQHYQVIAPRAISLKY